MKRSLAFFAILALLAYGLLAWQQGFYWDEFPMTWIYFQLGPEALARYFSTNRPFWGMIYQATLPLVGPNPPAWQGIALILRWLSAVLFWAVLRQTWPRHPRLALWAGALFLVYPGFGQHFISMMYSHFYIVLDVFLLSLLLSLLALRRNAPCLHVAALALSVVNLLAMEYFYFLEFMRLGLFWVALEGDKRRILRNASLYTALWLVVTLWRVFFFPYQTTNYKYVALDALRANPLLGAWQLLQSVTLSFFETFFRAWLAAFSPIDFGELGTITALASIALTLGAVLLSGLFLHGTGFPAAGETVSWARPALLVGLWAWLLGGGQFWLVGIQPKLEFNGDRFTLSFMLGASLMLAGLLALLAKHPKLQLILLALVLGFASGGQFQLSNAYRRDWSTQQNLFWQMSWRMPGLEPGTALISNDLPLMYFSDNSLSAPLNWLYSAPGRMDYVYYYASVRTQPGRALEAGFRPGVAFTQPYLAVDFYGNTSQMVALYFENGKCLRVLDPEIDPLNRLLDPLMREAAALSALSRIRAEEGVSLPGQFYSPEPVRGWCYIFQKAELARQQGNWREVVRLAESALTNGSQANDPLENFVYIEGYAHTGEWEKARALTKAAFRFSKEYMRPTLCALWSRIERETPNLSDKIETIVIVRSDLQCTP
jgi:hypothetical protein